MPPTGPYIGVDGCPGGWLAVDAGGAFPPRVYATIEELWHAHRSAARILIDVPIGLTDDARACDLEAKRLLGRWNSRVFLTPPREALYAETYARASQICRRIRGAGLSKQTWCISPRIREVDTFLRKTPPARAVVRECHPEICFWGLTGRVVPENKLTEDGLEARAAALERSIPSVRAVVSATARRFRNSAKPDDVLDALVAAWAAAGPAEELRTLPEAPPVDAEGLRAEMVYRRVARPVTIHPLPRLAGPAALAGASVIIVDQLRASSTIVAALHAGAAWVRPVPEVQRARAEARRADGPVLLGGERGGVRIDGFDLGNSPSEYTPRRVAGRGIVFTTTNGTAALAHATRAGAVAFGCLANRSAVARWAAGRAGPVHILCAGTHGLISAEDLLAAGAIAESLVEAGAGLTEDDAARVCLELWASARAGGGAGIRRALEASYGGRNLRAIGLARDIADCARVDRSGVVPILDAETGLLTADGR